MIDETYRMVAFAADVLDDLEAVRIANQNRLRQLTRTETDSDGRNRGFGLDESDPSVAQLAALVDMLCKAEHEASKQLERLVRKHPLGPWIKQQPGLGARQIGRLLKEIGDPYWHHAEDRPRTVSELWSYCGHGDPTRKRRKGMSQADLFKLGNPAAKMRLWNVANSCVKQKSGTTWRDIYDKRRANTEGRLHATDCVRCGPSGKPAPALSEWSKAHQHADALRILGKEILRDLWLEAKRLHEETP